MTEKVKTKADLIRILESLPDSWAPTKCIWWREPETVALVTNGEIMEYHQRLEIELRGPTNTVDTSKK